MATIRTDDGVNLYVEETGEGTPIVFVHEFAGDVRSYEPQVRWLARRYRCVTYNARGYPPSDVPTDASAYSQERARDDIRCVLDGLKIDRAHVVGVSMGGFATLHFGLAYPDRALSLVVAGCGYGARLDTRPQFQKEAEATADRLETGGMAKEAAVYGAGPTRVQYQNKDPRGWQEFIGQLSEHSAKGSANTMRGVQARRPSLYHLEDKLKALQVPTLVMTGDEDEPCLDESVYLKRRIPSAGLVVMPKTGHALNLEEPALFNQLVTDFFHQVERGRWALRDPRSIATNILGGTKV